MAIWSPLSFTSLKPVMTERHPVAATFFANPMGIRKQISVAQTGTTLGSFRLVVKSSKNTNEAQRSSAEKDDDRTSDTGSKAHTDNYNPLLMTEEERRDLRSKIRKVIASCPDVKVKMDPDERKRKMKKFLADYSLVVEDEDPNWPEDDEGWGFSFDQFFDKITIKNVKDDDDDDDDYDNDKEIVWRDDNYIRPIVDITTSQWEDTVFKDFNPLVILVHNRYKRPRDNNRARIELEKAIKTFWKTGLPSPRCAAVDAVVECDLASALKVSGFPEILFTKAGKILHRDKVVRTADEWSKIMAFFYYKAVRPSCIDKSVGQNQEKIPSL